MEITAAEAILVAAVVLGLCRVLRPLQRSLEDRILRFLDPGRGRIIDAELEEIRKQKPDKE